MSDNYCDNETDHFVDGKIEDLFSRNDLTSIGLLTPLGLKTFETTEPVVKYMQHENGVYILIGEAFKSLALEEGDSWDDLYDFIIPQGVMFPILGNENNVAF